MTLRSSLLVAAAAVLAQSTPLTQDGRFVQSPAGLVPAECYHEVPHGTVVEQAEDGHTAVLPSGERRSIPRCSSESWAAAFAANAVRKSSVLRGSAAAGAARSLQLPADYKGWVQYAGEYCLQIDCQHQHCIASLPRSTLQAAHRSYFATCSRPVPLG